MPVSTTAGQNGPNSAPTGLAQLLLDRGVRDVMVIDDALDAGPDRWIDLPIEVRELIKAAISENETLATRLQEQNLMPPENVASPGAECFLEKIQEIVPKDDDLRIIWEGHIEPFSKGLAKKEVNEIVGRLEALGITVHACGVIDPQDPPEHLSVVFIDYALDDTDSGNPPTRSIGEHPLEETKSGDLAAKSIEEINRIYDCLHSSNKPIVVLMSGRSKLTPADQARFRDETKIMPGMFFACQKSDMKGIGLDVILNDIGNNWDKALALQSFSHSVSEATQIAASAVSSMFNGLTLEDFALIQSLSLNADGHPLGEYVLWLTGAYFEQELGRNQAVRTSKAHVDKLVFEAPPITEWGPSHSFVSAYQAAAFADADDISSDAYPALDEEAKKRSGNLNDVVALHFGDVFVQEGVASSIAYVVLTPECDLVFGGLRPFPRNRSVVLLPGNLANEPPFKKSSDSTHRTELLRWKESNWRIQWRMKEVESVPLGNFNEWARQKNVTRVARIAFSFAAAIQHAYAGNLTRVGLPVVPPQFHPQNASVYVERWNQRLQRVCGPISNGAHLISSPQFEERKCILSDYLLMELQRNLPTAIDLARQLPTDEDLVKIPEEQREIAKNRAMERVHGNETNLRAFAENPAAIIALKGPHNLDSLTEAIELSDVTISSDGQALVSHPKTVLTVHLEDPGDAETAGQ